jgi:hypothetical protein
MADFYFASFVPVSQHRLLESLLYFNAGQDRVLAGIVDAVEKFGPPEIVNEGDRLRIRVAALPEAQTLFAIDSSGHRPVGVAVYARPAMDYISVVHLGVAEEFAAGGTRAQEQLLLQLVRELRRSTRQIKGVQRCELLYLQGRARSHGHQHGDYRKQLYA